MADLDAKLEEARVIYPAAEEAVLVRIAAKAQAAAEEAEAEGKEEGYAFSAVQSEYGCDWNWGDGTTFRDSKGNIVPDEDAEPTARVFDCDGNTIELVTDSAD